MGIETDFEMMEGFKQTQSKNNPNYCTFYNHTVDGPNGTFIDKVYVLIISPGQSKTEMRRPMQEQDKIEYPAQWKAFQEGKDMPLNGTPIDMLPGLTGSRVAALKLINIRTIEGLAEVAEIYLKDVGMDANTLKQRAKDYLQKNTKEVSELKVENQSLKDRLAELEAKFAKFTEKATINTTVQQPVLPKRRGRPPKVKENKVEPT